MSYEKNIFERVRQGNGLPEKLEFSILKYFWQSNPFISGNDKETIPRFLRKIKVLDNFSERELRIFCNYLHVRKFNAGDTIFTQGDLGIGFYFVLNGYIDIIADSVKSENQNSTREGVGLLLTLEKYDYFGELSLLEENSTRSASAISREGCTVIGIFKPDIEELIYTYPIIAAKLLQSVSLIVASRLSSVTSELKELRYKLRSYERDDNVS